MLLQRGKIWHTKFKHNGETIKRTTGQTNKKEAEKVAREIKKSFLKELVKSKLEKSAQYTFGAALVKWIETDAPQSMLSHARNTLIHLEHVPLVDIIPAAHDMKAEMAKRLAVPTVNRRLSVVQTVLNKAYREWEWLDQPLGDKIKKFSEKGTEREFYLEPDQFEELLRSIEHQEVRKFICIAAHTGLRRSELYNLRPENFKAPYIILPNKTKSKKARTVPLIEELHDTLTLPWDCSLNQIRYWFEKARKKMGIEYIRVHDLRHCFASWIASNPEIPLTTLRDLLGHSSLAVTSKYAHLRGQHFEAVSRTLGGTKKGTSTHAVH